MEIKLTADLLEEMLNKNVSPFDLQNADTGAYKETTDEVFIKRTTKTLIEDEELIDDLYYFTKYNYKFAEQDFTVDIIKDCLKNKYRILAIYKVNTETDSGYEEDWNDGSRWEGDYNPDGAYSYPKRYSFSDVIADFIELNPHKIKWQINEEWIRKGE